MDFHLFLLLFIPVLWPFVAAVFLAWTLNPVEIVAHLIVAVLLVTALYNYSKYHQAEDVQVLNGRVASKAREKVSCTHSYEVCSGSGDSRRCSTRYEHPYDFDWRVYSNFGRSINVPRADSQGLVMPARYGQVLIGESFHVLESFRNYVKAVPDSLFNTLGDSSAYSRFKAKVDSIGSPYRTYDLYRYNPLLVDPELELSSMGFAEFNSALTAMVADLGPDFKSNVVVVFTGEQDREFARALRSRWLGGKFNDTVVVLGFSGFPKVAWADVFGWADGQLYQVQIKDALNGAGVLSAKYLVQTIRAHIEQGFKPKSPEDFAYLDNQIEAPLWALLGTFALSLIVSIILTMYFHRANWFGLDGMLSFLQTKRKRQI